MATQTEILMTKRLREMTEHQWMDWVNHMTEESKKVWKYKNFDPAFWKSYMYQADKTCVTDTYAWALYQNVHEADSMEEAVTSLKELAVTPRTR